jgi:transposase InsO family protein
VKLAAEWRIDYNEVRPHSSLGNLTPTQYANGLRTRDDSQLSAA